MKIAIESTTKIVHLSGVKARIWEGVTESGIPVLCFVTRIAVKDGLDTSEFEKELQEHRVPSIEAEAIPLRMIL